MNHAYAELLQRLFAGLKLHDHEKMATCYHEQATFRDIAFDLRGRKTIHAMWHMISETDLRTTFHVTQANEQSGSVRLVDEYTFTSTGRRVRNVIDSRFRFENGLIREQQDSCDARLWGAMALGGVSGFLAGRLRPLRSHEARKLLQSFIEKHPEYQ